MTRTAPLFPAPKDLTAPWHRWHPRKILRRAEKLAGLGKLVGGDFHRYRRAWATSKKDLSAKDVARTGGWKSTRMLEIYQKTDADTMLSAVSATKRVRNVRGTRRTKLSKTHSNGRRA